MQDRALEEACRRGDLSACRQLVERHGERAARLAFLLSGDPRHVESLATAGMLAALRRVIAGDEDDVSDLISTEVARRFLTAPASEGSPRILDGDPFSGGERQRFTVDNERTRARNALALLDAPARAAFVLRLYCALPDDEIVAALGWNAAEYASGYRTAVSRLRANLDLESERELALSLVTAAFDAPRPDLWEAIEPEIERRFRREESQRRVVNAASALAVVAGLLVGVLVVSGALSNDKAGGETAGAQSRAQASTPAPFAILLPTATATPRAEVPEVLLVSSAAGGHGGTRFFHPGEDAGRQVIPEGGVEAAEPVVAPDGSLTVMLWYEFSGADVRGYAAGFGPNLTELLWKAEIASAAHDSGSSDRPAFFMAAAVDHERVYVARHFWESGDPVEIEVLDRETGARLETIQTSLASFVAHDIRLYAPPGHDAVHLFSITGESPVGQGQLRITTLAYRVPGGQKIHSRILRDIPDNRVFFLYGSRLTADGDYLFGIDYTEPYQEVAVHFYDLARGVVESRVPLPFQIIADPLPVQQAVSHDGRWLYVLSPASLELAVVDLSERRLQGIVPLDPGMVGGAPVDVVYPAGRQMQLSPDGQRLYAIGSSTGGEPARPSGVWVIDTSTWTVVQHLAPEIRPADLLLDDDGESLFVREVTSSLADAQDRLYVLDLTSGRVEEIAAPSAGKFSLQSLSALYRDLYAASPWVDGRARLATPPSRPLAAARVKVDLERVEAGLQVAVEIHFVHPLSGEPARQTAASGVRFQPPTFVRAIWQPDGDGDAIIVALGSSEYGVYRGIALLSDPGSWSLRVELDWPAEGVAVDRTLALPDAVEVEGVETPTINSGFGSLAIHPRPLAPHYPISSSPLFPVP